MTVVLWFVGSWTDHHIGPWTERQRGAWPGRAWLFPARLRFSRGLSRAEHSRSDAKDYLGGI
jgi:hypothetical protein